MTTTTLTQEEKRALIAKACGWRKEVFGPLVQDYRWHKPDGTPTHTSPPNYAEDLNAMHEAEKVIIERGLMHGMEGYDNVLCGIIDNGSNVHATADQKAEAFGRTLGLWD